MAADPRKRQKQQERRAAKRKAKHHQLARAKFAGIGQRLAAAAKYPVTRAWVTSDFYDKGLGQVCMSRELPNRQVAFVIFLVDRYCLGVKDINAQVVGGFTYDKQIENHVRSRFSVIDKSPATIRKLVEQSVAYAQKLGFSPPADYQKAKLIFGDLDPAQSTEEFEFGNKGQPFFIAGPHDDNARCHRILHTLEQSCGRGNYQFLLVHADASGDGVKIVEATEEDTAGEPPAE